jgi:D-alanyl-lipoteichoic acid acyltransferase DltB (MBOAT superfamily)
MIFSDPAFLAGFLPVVFVLFYAARLLLGGEASSTLLIVASMIFYAVWSIPFLLLLIGQLLFNYYIARYLRDHKSKWILTSAICLNLLLLGYFKYRNFFIENIFSLVGEYKILPSLIVPLGISFHTFQQIAFLITNNGKTGHFPPLKNYTLFVLFFPQLVAGPIVLNHEFEPQAEASRHNSGIDWDSVGPGIVIFIYGLFKKICLADNLAPYVDTAFNPSIHLQPIEAWLATISFVLQLFFDFSGYSDMAVGLGMMFGIRLPANFRDPLRALSIVDFWAHWHITMTRFFMTYVYTPLSVNMMRRCYDKRRPRPKRYTQFLLTGAFPTMVTFLAAGFWHGANWTFGFCGVTQGIALSINQAWRQWKLPKPPAILSWAMTMMVFCIGQVFFRAVTSHQALQMLAAMFSPWNIRIPPWLKLQLGALPIPTAEYEFLSGTSFTAELLLWNALLGSLVFALPNLSAVMKPLQPNFRLACYATVLLCLIVTYIGAPRTFLYFQF